MLISTRDGFADREVSETLGLVQGNAVRARAVGRDIIAGFRNIIGGEVSEYSKLMAESRQQATDRMVARAEELGADAVVTVRYTTSAISSGAAEVLAYGTAVKLASAKKTKA